MSSLPHLVLDNQMPVEDEKCSAYYCSTIHCGDIQIFKSRTENDVRISSAESNWNVKLHDFCFDKLSADPGNIHVTLPLPNTLDKIIVFSTAIGFKLMPHVS